MSAHPELRADRPVIIGAGIAGLVTALSLAPEPVTVLSYGVLGADTSTAWAQGGMAASVGADDSVDLHLADTIAAGHGLVDAVAARRIIEAAPSAVRMLAEFGVCFDKEGESLLLGLEAAHSRRRILHAGGDGSGQEIMRGLIAAVRRTPSITVMEGVQARGLCLDEGRVSGVLAVRGAAPFVVPTSRVVLATGGIGGLFLESTNPGASIGHGLALAAKAGARLANLEFIQFHPTALDTPARPMALISEAVRGEGAILVDEKGERFLAGLPGAELAPRDAVARGIWSHLVLGHAVYMDARTSPGPALARRFPGIAEICRQAGFDPRIQLLPVRPAVHYHMGGIAVDADGRSSVEGLWACGEVACSGLHGANRLASNSLVEAAVCGRWVADAVAGTPARRVSASVMPALAAPPDAAAVRPTLSQHLGVVREQSGLEAVLARLLPLVEAEGPAADPARVGLMIAVAALGRRESRGAHFRSDFPEPDEAAHSSSLCLDEALEVATGLTPSRARLARSA